LIKQKEITWRREGSKRRRRRRKRVWNEKVEKNQLIIDNDCELDEVYDQ
jgi:hypothetical protein